MALGRCRIFPCHLVRNRPTDQPTISSIHAINAPTRHRLDPTIRTGAFRPDPSCTVAAPEISIAPADRAAPFSRGFLPWRVSNAGPAAVVHVASTVMGPASETRHSSRPSRWFLAEWRCVSATDVSIRSKVREQNAREGRCRKTSARRLAPASELRTTHCENCRPVYL